MFFRSTSSQSAPFLTRAAVVLSLLALTASATAVTPTVLKTSPETGADHVDPATTEIRVTFDQDMSPKGWSWTGGGDTFPEMVGRPKWIDARTCVMTVKLKPDWEYSLGINSRSAQNFRNLAGEPATPFRLSFKTAPAVATTQAAADTLASNKAAVSKLRQLFDDNYSYRDRLGLDWNKLIEDARPALEQSRSAQAFMRELTKLLTKTEDVHVRVGLTGSEQLAGVYRRPGVLNFDLARVKKAVPDLTPVGKQTWVGRWDDATAYILIGAWDNETETAAALAGLVGAKRAIIDVRPNGGGDELLARKFAGVFTPKPVTYAKNQTRSEGKWLGPYDRILQPSTERPTFTGKTILLQGPRNFSSNESFIQMMSAAGVTTLGETTGGSSGNPKRFDLGNGVSVALPSWKDLNPDGSDVEGKGLKPAVEVKWVPDADTDVVLDKALELVRAK